VKAEFRESFERDLKAIKDSRIKNQLKKLIFKLESVSSLEQVPNTKKLVGGKNFYRTRVGDFRVGIELAGSTTTLVRVLHRKEIYRYFP
jgi:mRNA interferase RelE/StbE